MAAQRSGARPAGPKTRPAIERIQPYEPGKPVEEVQRELGITDVIKLASNESPIGPSPKAMEAARAMLPKLHVYPNGGAVPLRESLASRLGVSLGNVVVGNGSDELIKLLAEAYLEPEDEVVFAHPTFSEYAYATRLMGAQERPVPLRDMTHDLEAMAAAVGPRTKFVFICNPNNPTGTYVGRDAVEAFLKRMPPHVLVVFDEAYVDYVEAADFPDTIQYVRQGLPVLVMRTFSKIYGLAALRIGYAIGPEDVVANILRVKEPFNVNAVAQAAALAALEDEEHVARGKAVNREGKVYLARELAAMGVRTWPTEGNFIWMDVGVDSRAAHRALLQHGVIVRTGDIFGYPTFLRVTVGTPEQNRRFVTALRDVLSALRSGQEAAARQA